ncbi:uncharacterized protein rab11fip1a isoform X1 [Pygocentrus nattereri]|uniref:uncharacterized protein rab11fip1a isoform X1 n=1 Tax=Pygocentrus nattereri TaxID=42514 RepID=UPI00081428BD|nr:uncharacterized protein rab11fip1a isoform X1 [Pygocentrus nattereri]
MSLAEQSQQWYPTSVQVTVLEARNLRLKGKNGTNDAYAIMQVAKDKFSTSVAEKSVAPAWKEEATFDLPLFHRGNADRCTLCIIIMHRALVGLDKLLGQAIINLVDLQENKARKKTDWYKLVDKNGKADKERGEVLLDIQFMRNNMTASMFDLSMQDKPRSRISKLKDKVRGKKKDGLSDSASAIVPSTVNQVLTDSEGEDEANPNSPKGKKSSKLKSLFAPKSNLHRGVSQSMSTLGTLPEKNSSLSSSRSSGLNGESPDVKKKFKFLGHKRTSSTDSKVSLGPFSLLNRSKQNIPEQNNLCINGSHVYAEEQEPKPSFGSSLSLSSSAKGSVEDLRKYHERNASDVSADSFKGLSIPTYKPEPVEKALHIPQHPQEDEEKKHKKTEGRLQEVLERQEEQEKIRQQEREEKRRRQEEEERKIRLEEEQRKRLEEEQRQRKRREEEAKRVEEQRRQEESRVAERLTSIFGLGKKKEEPSPPDVEDPKLMNVPASTNPFEEIPLSPDSTNPFLGESPAKAQKEERSTFTPTPPASAFPGRTAKVSAVKPRLALSPKPETDNTDPLVSPVTSDIEPTVPGSSLSPKQSPCSDPFESFAMFSEIHSSLAPPKPQRTFAESPRGSMENLSGADYTASMSEKKHRALQPPSYPGGSSKNGNHHPENEVHSPTSQQGQRPPLPLPDYDSLFPKKRHGVMTDTRWEHIIAEVNQRKMDSHLKNIEEEMSVDAPNEPVPNKSEIIKERSLITNQHQKQYLEASSVSTTRMEPKQALIPPKSTTSATARQVLEVNSKQVLTPEPVYATVEKSNHFASRASTPKVQQDPQVKEKRTFSTAVSAVAQPSETKEKPTPASRAVKTSNSLENSDAKALRSDSAPKVQQEAQVKEKRTFNAAVNAVSQPSKMKEKRTLATRTVDKFNSLQNSSSDDDTTELPSAKPRRKVAEKEPVILVQPEKPTPLSLTLPEKAQVERKKDSMTQMSSWENKGLEGRMQAPVNVSNITRIAKNENVPKEQPVADASKGPEKEQIDSDPFPNDKLISLDPWAIPEQDTHQDDLFTSGLKKATKSNDLGLTPEDFDNFFGSTESKNNTHEFFGSVASKDEMDPFFDSVTSKGKKDSFFESVAVKDETHSKESHKNSSPLLQGRYSQRKKLAPQPPVNLEKTVKEKRTLDKPAPQFMPDADDVELTVMSVAGQSNSETTIAASKADLWGMDSFAPPSQALSSSATPELGSGGMSGGKNMLRAWVSPSEIQSVSSQTAGGGALTSRRPHPVKPLSSTESQSPSSISVGKDLKAPIIQEVAEKSKTAESGPYTQLTQEELITLVVKQQTELSKKDAKILELEDYIDNLLVRVIEEKPSILLALNSKV